MSVWVLAKVSCLSIKSAIVIGDDPPFDLLSPCPDGGMEVAFLVTVGDVTFEVTPELAAALALVTGGVMITGTSPAPLVLTVEVVVSRDALTVLAPLIGTSTPEVLFVLVPSWLIAAPDLSSTILKRIVD